MTQRYHALVWGALVLGSGCMEQYNPQPFLQKLAAERVMAHDFQPTLTAAGELPSEDELIAQRGRGKDAAVAALPGAAGGDAGFDPQQVYSTFCVACHGPAGDLQLNKARDLTDPQWHAQATDEQIKAVIRYGAVEASNRVDFSNRGPQYTVSNPLMTPWGPVILPAGASDEEQEQMLSDLVGFVRGLKKQ